VGSATDTIEPEVMGFVLDLHAKGNQRLPIHKSPNKICLFVIQNLLENQIYEISINDMIHYSDSDHILQWT
jgi:hypothetical protein